MTSTLELMRAISLTAFLALAFSAAANQFSCGETACSQRAPSLEKYSVANGYTGTVAPVDLSSHPQARRYRSVLRAGAASGPNFAGKYTIVTWGCGTACQELAIVDAKNGKVFFPSNLRLNAYHAVYEDPFPGAFQFELNSSLLVAIGSPNDTTKLGVFFYHWDGKVLRLVYEEPRKWE